MRRDWTRAWTQQVAGFFVDTSEFLLLFRDLDGKFGQLQAPLVGVDTLRDTARVLFFVQGHTTKRIDEICSRFCSPRVAAWYDRRLSLASRRGRDRDRGSWREVDHHVRVS